MVETEYSESKEHALKHLSKKELTISRIRKLVGEGITDVSEIAEKIGRSRAIVYGYLKQEKIPGVIRELGTKRELISRIRELIEDGVTNVNEIAERIDRKPAIVYRYIRQEKIPGVIREPAISRTRELVEEGITDVKEIAERIDRRPATVYKYIRQEKIPRPRSKPGTKRKELVDVLIREGHTLQYMGDREGVTKQAISLYIGATGQHELWEERKKEFWKEKKFSENEKQTQLQQARTNLVSVLNNAIDEAAEEQGWPMQKVVEYIRSFKFINKSRIQRKRRGKQDLRYIIPIFERYEKAEQKGIKISLEELGEGTGLYDKDVSRVLERARLKPFYRRFRRNR